MGGLISAVFSLYNSYWARSDGSFVDVSLHSGEGSEGSGEGLGGFGAEPGQVQQGSGEGSGEGSRKPWSKAKSGSTGFRRRFPKRFRRRSGGLWCRARSGSTGFRRSGGALVQSQVRFNTVSKKVPGKVWEALVQSQARFNAVSEKVPGKVWEAFFAEPCQVQQGSGEVSRKPWCKRQVRFNGFRRRLQRRFRRRFWESLGQVRFNRFNRVSSAWLRITVQKDL